MDVRHHEPATVHGSAPVAGSRKAIAARSHRPTSSGIGRQELRPGQSGRTPSLALIHARLRQFLERQTGDEATADTINRELATLITDDTAAIIVQSLSASELRTDFGTLALTRWSALDPHAAAAWVRNALTPTDQQLWLIGSHLAVTPGLLDGFVGALPDGSYKQSLLSGAALAIAETDPQRAARLADRLSSGDIQCSVYETIANAWVSTDPVAAEKWVTGITNPSLRERLLATGAKSLAATDPDLAVTWLDSAVRSPSLLTESTLSIIDTWAERDPTAAAAWVGSMPAQTSRVAAIEHVLQQWQNLDPVAAARWLSGLPEYSVILARAAAAQAEAAEPKS